MDSWLRRLEQGLPKSDARARKAWARQIVEADVSLESLLPLLHGEGRASQRFMWLIGDICELDPPRVATSLPLLFSLWDQMPFPGMPRTVAKCLLLTGVPKSIAATATERLSKWLDDPAISIGCKHYSAHALLALVLEDRFPASRLRKSLQAQSRHANKAHASRMLKLIQRLPA